MKIIYFPTAFSLDTANPNFFIGAVEVGAGVVIFGAKKLKNGTALILTNSQSESKDKEWKEKDAIGRITKTGTSYIGRLHLNKGLEVIQERSLFRFNSHDSSKGTEGILFESDLTPIATYSGLQTNPTSPTEHLNLLDAGIFSGPLAVSVSSCGADKLIQASVIIADASSSDRFIEGTLIEIEILCILCLLIYLSYRLCAKLKLCSIAALPYHTISSLLYCTALTKVIGHIKTKSI